jgi:polyisoprenoid-binding protein YceI
MKSLFSVVNSCAIICLALFCVPEKSDAAQTYFFEKSNTKVTLQADYAPYTPMVDKFLNYEGSLTFDETNLQLSNITVKITPSELGSAAAAYDAQLSGAAFFEGEKPEAIFTSNKIILTGLNSGIVSGTLSIMGNSKPLAMQVTLNKMGYDRQTNSYKTLLTLQGEFKRSDWGVDAYLQNVGDYVIMKVETQVARPAEKHEVEPVIVKPYE